MYKVVEILGCGWSAAGIVLDYIEGKVWWAQLVDAGFLVAGVVSAGASLMEIAAKKGMQVIIRREMKKAGRKAAMKL